MAERSKQFPARVFGILAREQPVGILLRRGPSKWTQLIRWNLADDTFQPGQWFHGRIYERRCDLSPDGSLLIYFAQKINRQTIEDKEYTYAWTAISRPPWFAALALWPKGDCWHGGGLFRDGKTVMVNHHQPKPHPSHRPTGLKVQANPEARGECLPVFWSRLKRDGWRHVGAIAKPERGNQRRIGETRDTFEKRQTNCLAGMLMMDSIATLDHPQGTGCYFEQYAIRSATGEERTALAGVEWADWDQRGRLVFSRCGCVFAARVMNGVPCEERMLADFNDVKPEAIAAPQEAKRW